MVLPGGERGVKAGVFPRPEGPRRNGPRPSGPPRDPQQYFELRTTPAKLEERTGGQGPERCWRARTGRGDGGGGGASSDEGVIRAAGEQGGLNTPVRAVFAGDRDDVDAARSPFVGMGREVNERGEAEPSDPR